MDITKLGKSCRKTEHGQVQPVLVDDIFNLNYAWFDTESQKKPKDPKGGKWPLFKGFEGQKKQPQN